MRFKSGGKTNTLVLLNAKASSARLMDAFNIRRFVAGPDDTPKVMKASVKAKNKAVKQSKRTRRAM
jgi:D-alanyl-D-alanine carboxypeptidase/D-alanyl-D-alanine endopeptidase (penicillin-binding protein 7)